MPRHLVLLALLLALLQCAPPVEVSLDEINMPMSSAALVTPGRRHTSVSSPSESAPGAAASRSSLDVENVCEGLVAVQHTRNGKVRTSHRRDRYVRTREDRRRTKDLIRLVAREMGVEEPDFFVDMALHESTWNPEAIHILNPDEEANKQAWARHTYSATKERRLEHELTTHSAKSKKYWAAKRQLSSIRRFRSNPYWYDQLRFPFVIEGSEAKLEDQRSVWSFGYGLYGHNAVLYMPYWGPEAPPWILCAHEGIVATIVEVWAARKAAKDCAYLSRKDPEQWGTDGGNYRGVLRRLARGHCGDQKLGGAWSKIMHASTVPWEMPARFGTRFSREEVDPQRVLSHMLEVARREGRLRTEPLARRGSHRPTVVIHAGSVSTGS